MARRTWGQEEDTGGTNEPTSIKRKKRKISKSDNSNSSVQAPKRGSVNVRRHEFSVEQRLPKTITVHTNKYPEESMQATFPPTIYTNVEYSNGICISSHGGNKLDIPQDYMVAVYGNPNYPYSPCLPHAEVWGHKFAAVESTRHGFTLSVYRLLGTITRTVGASTSPFSTWNNEETKSRRTGQTDQPTVPAIKRMRISRAQAAKQASMELPSAADRSARVLEIQDLWNRYWSPDPIPKMWDPQYGHLLSHMVNDDRYLPLQALVSWDFQESTEIVQLYHGLREVPVDTRSVLNSLADLQSPLGLYGIPLVMTFPLVKQTKENVYELRVGVYAHRLLPEVLLQQDLLRIMTALDRDSFNITEPIHVPPTPAQPTFASATLPKLLFDVSEAKDNNTSNENEDLTLGESTRETSETLSAFTIAGLLKLWENTGNDISEWPDIEPIVRENLTMKLLLHQQHALCWMRQMESLDGFGINSILWEEREWHDGGKYYYSPALGQLRLGRPAKMRGGILADEMGLGKTIMILALIVTTLDDLKREGCHTTLIVVPPALMWQWKAEISNAAPRINVQMFNADTGPDITAEADIVITTYQVVASKHLRERSWGRIVLDEMQEIRSSSTVIARNCDKLKSGRRWMLSGTPLFDGIEDLKGELNFLNLEPYAAKSEDGFFNFSITSHWSMHSRHGLETLKVLGLLLLRRTKTMTICNTGAPLMGLKSMTVEFVPVPQTEYERALYCFLEYVVAALLSKETSGLSRLCLRLLRELCISPTLLSGGLGVSSELVNLNHLVNLYNRRSWNEPELHSGLIQARTGISGHRLLSCEDAIRYLSQAQTKILTGEDFVTDLNLSAGGGMAKRNRATDSVDERRKECQQKLLVGQKRIKWAKATKARAHWHRALERISTGQVRLPSTVSRSIAAVWRWRVAVVGISKSNAESMPSEAGSPDQRMSHSAISKSTGSLRRSRTLDQEYVAVLSDSPKKLPSMLTRGWRPSPMFMNTELPKNHPDFAWTHPVVLALHNIPCDVKTYELHDALAAVLDPATYKIVHKSKGRAYIQFNDADQAKTLRQHVKRGIQVQTACKVPFLEKELEEHKSAYEQAKKENVVYSTVSSRRRVKTAQRKLEAANRGLLIVGDEDSPHIRLGRAKGPPRSLHPGTSAELFSLINADIDDSNACLTMYAPIVAEQLKLLKSLERATEVSEDIKQMSAFESLEAISFKEYHKTSCVICMGFLGSSDPNFDDESTPGLIGLTPCCHLFCACCINDYIANQNGDENIAKCPTCRKEIESKTMMNVDPSLCSNSKESGAMLRSGAKKLIERAAKMLDESNGQLDQNMWLQLFLAIDPPLHVSQRGDPRLASIPREVISFFRAATCFEHVHNNAAALPSLDPAHGLSSKMEALYRDLPKTERSVIFTSSRNSVHHLMALATYHSIDHRAVFSGQSPSQAERAVMEWKDASVVSNIDDDEKEFKSPCGDNPLVLIVQSGAAASGLTLTAACKMFFLEPFVRQEEEMQALARCHRIGQNHAVHAKVYFSPVSVESRLLEWRKQVATTTRADTKIVYSDMIITDDDEEENLDVTEELDEQTRELEDTDQTHFLLGLR